MFTLTVVRDRAPSCVVGLLLKLSSPCSLNAQCFPSSLCMVFLVMVLGKILAPEASMAL